MNATIRALSVAAIAALAGGCESALTGNEGNFQFRYPADDRVLDFNKPLAVGARLDLSVVDVGKQRPVSLSDAASDDPEVIAVDSFAGNVIVLSGEGDGNMLLEVEGTTADGETLTDSVNLNARVPEVLVLNHTCGAWGSRSQAYLRDQRIYVPFELEMDNGQPVIGYGYHPVTPTGPEIAIDAGHEGQQYLAIDTLSAGPVTLASDLDDTTLDLQIVAPSDLDGVDQPTAFVLEDIDVGDTNAFYVLPQAGGATVCQADVTFEVASDTPEICDVRRLRRSARGGGRHRPGQRVRLVRGRGQGRGDVRLHRDLPRGQRGAGGGRAVHLPHRALKAFTDRAIGGAR